MTASSNPPTVVVGVDGSPQALAALRWAAQYAQASGAALRAVTAWRYPTTYGIAPDWSEAHFAADAAEQLRASVSAALGDSPPVLVETAVIEGRPAPVLLAEARDADLLVVGSHGRGHFAGMLVGSVSTHCVEHAACPVVVVRGEV